MLSSYRFLVKGSSFLHLLNHLPPSSRAPTSPSPCALNQFLGSFKRTLFSSSPVHTSEGGGGGGGAGPTAPDNHVPATIITGFLGSGKVETKDSNFIVYFFVFGFLCSEKGLTVFNYMVFNGRPLY